MKITERNKRRRKALCAAVLCLCMAVSAPVFAQADGQEIDFEDATATEALQPVLSLEEALTLAQIDLGADGAWTTACAEPDSDNGRLFYSIVLIDPVGDAHMRTVDAQTGEVAVVSLWESDGRSGDGERDAQKDERDHSDEKDGSENAGQDAGGEQDLQSTASAEPEPDTGANASALPVTSCGEALDALIDALGSREGWSFETGAAVMTGGGLAFPVTAVTQNGTRYEYLVDSLTGRISRAGE